MRIQVEKLALEKWGGQEKLDAERAKRHEKRLDRERAKAGMTSARISQALAVLSIMPCTDFNCKRIQHGGGHHFWHVVVILSLKNLCSLSSCPDLRLEVEMCIWLLLGVREVAQDMYGSTAQQVMHAASPAESAVSTASAEASSSQHEAATPSAGAQMLCAIIALKLVCGIIGARQLASQACAIYR